PKFGQQGAISRDAAVSFSDMDWVSVGGAEESTFAFSGRAQFTLEAWIEPTCLGPTCFPVICSKAIGGEGYIFSVEQGHLRAGRFAGGMSDDAYADKTPMPTGFSYVAATFDGSNLKLYLNGTPIKQVLSKRSLTPNGAVFSISATSGGAEGFWSGVLDEVAV